MVSQLCDDILSQIFIHALEKRDVYYTVVSSRSAPLSVRAVDKRWNNVAVNTPELWRSISIRRRVRPPYGYSFEMDANLTYEWLGNSMGLPLSVQLCYGDIKKFGKSLLWTDLLQTTTACLSEESTCEHIYIRVPDDCAEKFLWSLQTSSLEVKSLRSLAFRSTREGLLQKRYKAWWKSDHSTESYPRYCHILNIQGLHSLEELEIHYPGPLVFDGLSMSVKRLTMSLYKLRQLNESLPESFRNLHHLTLDLRESLQLLLPTPTDWNMITFPKLRALKIRSSLYGHKGKLVLEEFFKRVHFPQLLTLQLRNTRKFDPGLHLSKIIPHCNNFNCIEELEMIDFPFNPTDGSAFRSMVAQMPYLRTLLYREVTVNGDAIDLANGLLSTLQLITFAGSSPPLEVFAIDTADLREVQTNSLAVVLRLVSFLITWRSASEKTRQETGSQVHRPQPRKLLLPKGASERLFAQGAAAICGDVEFDWLADVEETVEEDDLDDGDDSCCGQSFLSPINAEEMVVVDGRAIPARIAKKFGRPHRTDSEDESQAINYGSIQEVERLVFGGLGWTDSLTEVEMLL